MRKLTNLRQLSDHIRQHGIREINILLKDVEVKNSQIIGHFLYSGTPPKGKSVSFLNKCFLKTENLPKGTNIFDEPAVKSFLGAEKLQKELQSAFSFITVTITVAEKFSRYVS